MHIAHIVDQLDWGGAQKLLLTFTRVAEQRGLAPTIISLADRGMGAGLAGQLRRHGARVVAFGAPKLLNGPRLWRLARFLQGERFEVVQSHLTYANILGPMAGWLARTPVIATLHSAGLDPSLNPRAHQLERWTLRHLARAVIAVGPSVAAQQQARLSGTPCAIVPNAVEPGDTPTAEERAALRAELVGDPSRPLLISVGRLVPYKAFDELIASFAQLRAWHPAAALAIVGGGELQAALEAQVAAAGLAGHVFLLGQRDDIPRILPAADLFVSASRLEGLPISLLEAMGAGLPIVATDVGDSAHVVVEGTGAIVPPGQPEPLLAALRALLDDPARMRAAGAAARAHVAGHYGAERWVDRLLDLYGRLGRPRQEALPAAARRP